MWLFWFHPILQIKYSWKIQLGCLSLVYIYKNIECLHAWLSSITLGFVLSETDYYPSELHHNFSNFFHILKLSNELQQITEWYEAIFWFWGLYSICTSKGLGSISLKECEVNSLENHQKTVRSHLLRKICYAKYFQRYWQSHFGYS
jgi:hypothetical protein